MSDVELSEGKNILRSVERYYSGRLAQHGATARGVDWNSEASQQLRFDQLLKVCGTPQGPVSILDFGCGYGALLDALTAKGWAFKYQGYDICEAMTDAARARHDADGRVRFVSELSALEPADYVVASGIFNVRLETAEDVWKAYFQDTLGEMAVLATRGFSFNALTAYSDADRQRPDLYYADPITWFQHCRRRYSRHISLLHNYPLYEFTMLVNLVPLES
ncbi:MAG: class I SAM-dependent methyltransferase [Gemmatimonadota bacterium]|nr:class I SAM-dependent methyltransferase [Gemmatimonadota bacterium]